MTESQSQSGSVQQNVEKEVSSLRSDLKQIADDIGGKIDQAGQEAKETWKKLEAERQQFAKQIEQAAEETKADLRQAGSDLKRRFQTLRDQLKGKKSEGEGTSSPQSGS